MTRWLVRRRNSVRLMLPISYHVMITVLIILPYLMIAGALVIITWTLQAVVTVRPVILPKE